jgi:hypothetical protein
LGLPDSLIQAGLCESVIQAGLPDFVIQAGLSESVIQAGLPLHQPSQKLRLPSGSGYSLQACLSGR